MQQPAPSCTNTSDCNKELMAPALAMTQTVDLVMSRKNRGNRNSYIGRNIFRPSRLSMSYLNELSYYLTLDFDTFAFQIFHNNETFS